MTMLVTPENNRRNQINARALTGVVMSACLVVGWFFPFALLSLGLCPLIYWLVRRRCLRRLRIASQPFPASWEQVLQAHVGYFRALADDDKDRFRQLIKVFLDEVRITGIRTDVDDTVRVLVAASAVIPIFGFHDWEYHRLGEVLVYPDSFGEKYQTKGSADENILGMVGLNHLSGVMILSKPSLLAGFDDPSSHDNVGVHEFAHLVEKGEVERGLPKEVPWQAVKQWVQYVAQELAHPSKNRSYISSYAYTNEHEFLAVLAEYFFKTPDLLKEKDPQLYGMLREMFHQDTSAVLRMANSGRQRFDGNAYCPCGSEKTYKRCCLLKSTEGAIKAEAS
jgi:Mlc titration factor MtfA (ptsG expression regulator)